MKLLPTAGRQLHEPIACVAGAFSTAEAVVNHERREARNALHRRFGYDAEANVRFVMQQALPLSGQILDIGTGKGRFVVALARQGLNLTTVDISAEEQRYARLEAVYAGVASRISFVQADARALPWRAASFDAVLSMNAFHHLTDPLGVFHELLRVLKPRAKLVLADFSAAGFRIMDEIHRAEGRQHPCAPNRFRHWQSRLRLAGFEARCLASFQEDVLIARRGWANDELQSSPAIK